MGVIPGYTAFLCLWLVTGTPPWAKDSVARLVKSYLKPEVSGSDLVQSSFLCSPWIGSELYPIPQPTGAFISLPLKGDAQQQMRRKRCFNRKAINQTFAYRPRWQWDRQPYSAINRLFASSTYSTYHSSCEGIIRPRATHTYMVHAPVLHMAIDVFDGRFHVALATSNKIIHVAFMTNYYLGELWMSNLIWKIVHTSHNIT